MRFASVVAVAVLAAMVLLPLSGVLAGPIADGGDPGSPWGVTATPGAATQEFRYPTTADFVENKGQLRRHDIFFYTTSGSVQEGFAESAVLVKIVEREPAPVRTPMRPHFADLSSPEPSTSRGVLIRIAFEGSDPVRPEGVDLLPHRSHYFLGNDPAGWRTDVPHYAQIVYRDLYSGVDVAYGIGADGLKYDITVRPDADPHGIVLAYEGVEGLVDLDGGLVVRTALGDLSDSIPRSYQGEEEVACHFDLRTSLSYGFDCGSWDASIPLVIDPLIYSTFLGGGAADSANSIAVDASGSAYVIGGTDSTDFPTTPGAFDNSYDYADFFVAKLDPTGSALLYSTFLGGSGLESGSSIAVDASGSAYVTGYTASSDFPVLGAFDYTFNGFADAFVAKLNATGSGLLYSTYLGGFRNDDGSSIAVDASGSTYVTGSTDATDFPTTPGAFDPAYNGNYDAFVSKLNPTGSSLVYSTYVGGGDDDWGISIAVDVAPPASAPSAYVTGWTRSTDFPLLGAFDTSNNGWSDAFVTKLNVDGSGVVYSTYLGGSTSEGGSHIAVDALGSAYVAGGTDSIDFPATLGAFDISHNGGMDAFVAKLNPAGSDLLYSTFLGGGKDEFWQSPIAIDAEGSAYVTGYTASADFPTTPGAHDAAHNGGNDSFVTKLNATGSGLLYSTFLGGSDEDLGSSIAVDASGSAYVTGGTVSTDFPTTPDAHDASNGGVDAFVAKLNLPGGPNSPPFLILASPFGGEVWDRGSLHMVAWTATDNQDPSTDLVAFLNYTSAEGSGTVCGPVPGSPGSCDWSVPNLVATDVVVNGTIVDTGGLRGWDESGPFTIRVPPNAPPTANAGTEQDVFKNSLVTLDGSASSDPDMEALTYAWIQVYGPRSVDLVTESASAVTFTAPTGAGAVGVYMFALTVFDPSGANTTGTVRVTVLNRIPVADAGPDQNAGKGSVVTLAGSDSHDPDGDPLAYRWTQVLGPASVTLRNATTISPEFAAQVVGTYVFRLEATDTEGAVASDEIAVTVWGLAPTAIITADPTDAEVGAAISFDGTGSSDLDGTIVDYAFDFGDGTPPVSGPSPAQTHVFSTPGSYTVSLTVTDDDGNTSAPATVQVSITLPTANGPPTAAIVVTPTTGDVGTVFTFDGSASTDEGTIVAYTWDFGDETMGSGVVVTHRYARNGTFAVTLTVTDDGGLEGTAAASVDVSIAAGDTTPRDGSDDRTIIGIAVIITGLIIAVLWRLRVVWFPYFILWLYSKLRRDEVLDNFTRGQTYEYVRLNPGDTYTDIKRNVGLASGPLTYHLAVLEREELIRSVVRGSRKLFYPRDVQIPENGGGLHALQARILSALREDPGIAVNDLAAALGISRQVALYHVRKLVRADLARLERRVRGLRAFPNSGAGL